MSALTAVLDSPMWRHVVTISAVAIALGALWGTTKADIETLKSRQGDTQQTIGAIRDAIGQARVDAAVAKQRLQELNRRINALDRKLDTLIWRTSPSNPSSPYPRQESKE